MIQLIDDSNSMNILIIHGAATQRNSTMAEAQHERPRRDLFLRGHRGLKLKKQVQNTSWLLMKSMKAPNDPKSFQTNFH